MVVTPLSSSIVTTSSLACGAQSITIDTVASALAAPVSSTALYEKPAGPHTPALGWNVNAPVGASVAVPFTTDPAVRLAVRLLRPKSLPRTPGTAMISGVWKFVWYGPSLVAIGAVEVESMPMFQRLAWLVRMVSRMSLFSAAPPARSVIHGSRFAAGIDVAPMQSGIRMPFL